MCQCPSSQVCIPPRTCGALLILEPRVPLFEPGPPGPLEVSHLCHGPAPRPPLWAETPWCLVVERLSGLCSSPSSVRGKVDTGTHAQSRAVGGGWQGKAGTLLPQASAGSGGRGAATSCPGRRDCNSGSGGLPQITSSPNTRGPISHPRASRMTPAVPDVRGRTSVCRPGGSSGTFCLPTAWASCFQ